MQLTSVCGFVCPRGREMSELKHGALLREQGCKKRQC